MSTIDVKDEFDKLMATAKPQYNSIAYRTLTAKDLSEVSAIELYSCVQCFVWMAVVHPDDCVVGYMWERYGIRYKLNANK